MKKKHPVKLERKKTCGGIDLEIKRFYVPGFVLKTKCPKCGGDFERDYGEDYLSYPPVGKPFKETLYCCADVDDGGTCEHEWEVTLRLDVRLSVPTSSTPQKGSNG